MTLTSDLRKFAPECAILHAAFPFWLQMSAMRLDTRQAPQSVPLLTGSGLGHSARNVPA